MYEDTKRTKKNVLEGLNSECLGPKGRKMNGCTALKKNRMVCNAQVYDETGRCGRHGGLTGRMWIGMRRQLVKERRTQISVPKDVPKTLICYKKKEEDMCLICLDIMSGCCELPCCKQVTCEDCLQGWLNNGKKTCPHCGKNLYDLYATEKIDLSKEALEEFYEIVRGYKKN